MTIQAIETHYKGYKFRSRLEARWAVFFESLALKWRYEVEGYVVDGIPYLPDFEITTWDTRQRVFVEIKHVGDENGDFYAKAIRLGMNTGDRVFIFFGDPFDCFYREDGLSADLCYKDSAAPLDGYEARLFFIMLAIEKGFIEANPLVRDAATTARRARFEFGEKG